MDQIMLMILIRARADAADFYLCFKACLKMKYSRRTSTRPLVSTPEFYETILTYSYTLSLLVPFVYTGS